MDDFDPNGPGIKGTIFGKPCSVEDSDIVIIPVPWEVTVSYRAGTADGPDAVIEASSQIDLNQRGIKDSWKMNVGALPLDQNIRKENLKYRDLASTYIHWIEEGGQQEDNAFKVIPQAVNDVCEKLNIYITNKSLEQLKAGRIVGILGGDHSTPLGLIRALGRVYNKFGILQIDAHADLRINYQDFMFGHSGIMHNALKVPQVSHLVQVGVRDLCESEDKYIARFPERISCFHDQEIKDALFSGAQWAGICNRMIEPLPEYVYLSVDIDGLEPGLCPNTGTPVPGGLSFEQLTYLVRAVVSSGRKIIGFDLCEVSPGEMEWDAIVGARLLYQLCCWTAVSQGKLLRTDN